MGCAALILVLGIFAAGPALHKQLHDVTHTTAHDVCAACLFANGIVTAVPVVAGPPLSAEWQGRTGVTAREIFLDSPRYLLQPERGPPVA